MASVRGSRCSAHILNPGTGNRLRHWPRMFSFWGDSRSGFDWQARTHHRVQRGRSKAVTRKKTSFTATPKRIFKFLGRLINSSSHFFQVISLDFCRQSTFRTYDFRILLEIGNFNLRRVAASLTFHWELSVVKEIRFHFRKHSTLGRGKEQPRQPPESW